MSPPSVDTLYQVKPGKESREVDGQTKSSSLGDSSTNSTGHRQTIVRDEKLKVRVPGAKVQQLLCGTPEVNVVVFINH